MNFPEAENYLYSLGNEVETMKLGLENIRTLLNALGNPQDNYKKVQVAGTNGKGSVCAFLDSMCGRAGIRTGLYTSPHLVSITERVKIEGVDISEEDFARLATRVREASGKLVDDGRLERVPTFFEQVTAIALLAFAEAKVELAILETGLGGRFDAVTAANAEIAAITRIDLDHQEYLGDTIEKIAAEKAAIIRADSKVVLLHQQRDVEEVLAGRCRELGVEPVWATRKIEVTRDPAMKEYLIARFLTDNNDYQNILFFRMFGRHQIENASVAIAVTEMLSSFGFEIDTDAVSYGIEDTRHPGRLEYIGNFLLDGAHNPNGAKSLVAYLDEFVDKPITMIFGAMRDKDVGRVAEILWPKAEKLILTQPSNSRAISVDYLFRLSSDSVNQRCVVVADNIVDSIDRAKETSKDRIVVVTGSLYLVGEVRRILTETGVGHTVKESKA